MTDAQRVEDKPLSTARLYTLTQPGHSLWGIARKLDLLIPTGLEKADAIVIVREDSVR